ncbi:hypothetical protein LN996_14175 [Arthrobacter sp. AK01]|uniref:hypothetical protein n=1 Tax=Micrococcaceae TaxID=1268 RepID=UPI001E377A27|nr:MULTISPECIES: hypothetical protein [Micrococcaceae]MCD4851963.1 hypothetical protein [Arthrobacter sp. AK01]MCP1412612.1 hypothetical protein [Paenarthrobacter sp. A20]
MLGQRMYAWRRPLWPVTLAIVVADIVVWFLLINGVTGGDPALGNVAFVVTIGWLVLGQSIGPKLRARRGGPQGAKTERADLGRDH